MDRRLLTGIGFAVVAALLVGAVLLGTGVAYELAAPDEYDVRTITGGLNRIDIHEEYGGTLENVLFDQRESGAMAEILANGGEFTIRNVAFVGPADATGSRKQIRPSVRNPDETGTIENVYMADGAAQPGDDVMGIYVEDAHAGTLEIRNVNVSGFSDNGMYCSDPGYDFDGLNPAYGEVHIENCYAHNNNISQFRIGSAGSYVRDSVAVIDDPSAFPAAALGKNARGVWFRNTPEVTAEGCDVYQAEEWGACESADGGDGLVRDSRVHGPIQDGIRTENVSPCEENPSPPSGVPLTAEAAVTADGSDGSNAN
jgi:hypothetical protein